MTDTETATLAIREQILSDPGLILEDHELMRAILQADRSAVGRNVVDLRGVLVDRLEERLDRLEDTHREVLAAAYENVAGMNQVHRACLALLEPGDFAEFLKVLTSDVAPILGVEVIRLGLEAPAAEPGAGLGPDGPYRNTVIALPAGGVDAYVTRGRGLGARRVTLRQLRKASPDLYGAEAPEIRSEALIRLGLGARLDDPRLDDSGGGHPALLAFGAHDGHRFHPDQGTDLLAFFGAVLERTLRRWLA